VRRFLSLHLSSFLRDYLPIDTTIPPSPTRPLVFVSPSTSALATFALLALSRLPSLPAAALPPSSFRPLPLPRHLCFAFSRLTAAAYASTAAASHALSQPPPLALRSSFFVKAILASLPLLSERVPFSLPGVARPLVHFVLSWDAFERTHRRGPKSALHCPLTRFKYP
jgi:hypothetical protein